MKTTALFLTLFLLTGLACKDKLDKSCDANFLEADINNVFWQAEEVTGFSFGVGGHITIQAKANFGQVREIVIQVPMVVTTGTYQLQTGVFLHSIVVIPGAFQAETGELTITVHDTTNKIIKGTFFFSTPSEGLTVEAGSFCAKY
ncbi:MAG: hypothetical protein J0M29_14945 [Chitinophagales bacterium]|nr:hypothetical protein [Chitinophagales bacterium]